VDRTAGEILKLSADPPVPSFKDAGKPCQEFYRRIARWHLLKVRKEGS